MLLALALGAIAALGACGQKGPLYLPGDPSRIRTEIPEVAQPEGETEEETDAPAPPE